jgi:metallo-beta-lactamase class B
VKRLLVLLVAAGCAATASASFNPSWNKPFPPHRVIGNLFYVGTNFLSTYLIATNEGHILINPDFEESVPIIAASMEKLGYHIKDVKIILISHAHDDHCAGLAKMKELTHARIMVMDGDVQEVEDGGASDPFYKGQHWTPVKVDRVLHDGTEIALGGITLTAHKTPGHTRGCTTWTTRILNRDVVIVGSVSLTSEYRLTDSSKYPGVVADFQHSFEVLRSLRCDVFLGAHGNYYNMEEKYRKLMQGGPNPFIDERGYQAFVAESEVAFKNALRKERSR